MLGIKKRLAHTSIAYAYAYALNDFERRPPSQTRAYLHGLAHTAYAYAYAYALMDFEHTAVRHPTSIDSRISQWNLFLLTRSCAFPEVHYTVELA